MLIKSLFSRRRFIAAATSSLTALMFGAGVQAADPVKIGLVAALSGQSAKSGEAITRGLTMAIEEINGAEYWNSIHNPAYGFDFAVPCFWEIEGPYDNPGGGGKKITP